MPAHEVVVLQPYGSLFFASAPTLRDRLPVADDDSRGSVVILRMRGVDEIGLSLIAVLREYAATLAAHDCSLVLTLGNDRVLGQLRHEGLVAALGEAERPAWAPSGVARPCAGRIGRRANALTRRTIGPRRRRWT